MSKWETPDSMGLQARYCSMRTLSVPAAVQSYVEQLQRCLQLEASDQPSASASVGVVKLANEIVSDPALLALLAP